MDGVLSDFDKSFTNINNIGNTTGKIKFENGAKGVPIPVMWGKINKNPIMFWKDMPVMSGAKELVDLVKSTGIELYVLTAPPSNKEINVGDIKKEWIQKHFPNVFKEVIICDRKNKFKYSNSTSLLIDDNEKSCQEWINSEGKSIVYDNSLINDLEKLKKRLYDKLG